MAGNTIKIELFGTICPSIDNQSNIYGRPENGIGNSGSSLIIFVKSVLSGDNEKADELVKLGSWSLGPGNENNSLCANALKHWVTTEHCERWLGFDDGEMRTKNFPSKPARSRSKFLLKLYQKREQIRQCPLNVPAYQDEEKGFRIIHKWGSQFSAVSNLYI